MLGGNHLDNDVALWFKVEVETLLEICVNYEPSGRCVGLVTTVETNIDHLLADERDHPEGLGGPKRVQVSIVWARSLRVSRSDRDWQVIVTSFDPFEGKDRNRKMIAAWL